MIFPTFTRSSHVSRWQRLLLVASIALPLSVSVADDEHDDHPILEPVPERPLAPDFALPQPDGTLYRLAETRGGPVILNFWATWCPSCRAEMPSMQRAHQMLAEEGIAVVAVNVGDDAQEVAAFLAEMPVDFPLPMDADTKITTRYPVIGLPTTFIIDPDGRLVYSATGERDWDDPVLLDQVRALKR